MTMEFQNQEELPSMKSLRRNFRRLAIEKHPDKGGNNEEFKKLYQAYEALGNIIAAEENKDVNDNEEMEARRKFHEENWEEVNSASITVKIKTSEGRAWESVLNENYGEPVKNSENESENKGEKYTTNFKHEGEVCKMFITIFNPNKKLNPVTLVCCF